MSIILTNLRNAVITGIVLTVIMVVIVTYAHPDATFSLDHEWSAFFIRWLHVLSGVMWIGLLWYLNFVQIPNMPNIPDEQKPAISKVIAPAVLFWFRWAAMATLITGLLLAHLNGYLLEAILLGHRRCRQIHRHRYRHVAGRDHVVQRVVCDLAESKTRPWLGGRGRRCQSRLSPPGDALLASQHGAVDPHALRHGIGAKSLLSHRLPPTPPPVNARLKFNARTAPGWWRRRSPRWSPRRKSFVASGSECRRP